MIAALPWPDGLRRIRPAHIIRTREWRPTLRSLYVPTGVENGWWLS